MVSGLRLLLCFLATLAVADPPKFLPPDAAQSGSAHKTAPPLGKNANAPLFGKNAKAPSSKVQGKKGVPKRSALPSKFQARRGVPNPEGSSLPSKFQGKKNVPKASSLPSKFQGKKGVPKPKGSSLPSKFQGKKGVPKPKGSSLPSKFQGKKNVPKGSSLPSKFQGKKNVPKPASIIAQAAQRKADMVSRLAFGGMGGKKPGFGGLLGMGKDGKAKPGPSWPKGKYGKDVQDRHMQGIRVQQEKQFTSMDVNRDGVLTTAELLQMREKLQARLAEGGRLDEVASTLLRKIGKDEFVENVNTDFNGQLTLNEFMFGKKVEPDPQEL